MNADTIEMIDYYVMKELVFRSLLNNGLDLTLTLYSTSDYESNLIKKIYADMI